jgi:hypothetical protein
LKSYEKAGWIGCMGCLDVMKGQWKNCAMAWRDTYQGKEKVPTVVLEAIMYHRLWFWHLFFSMPGANNDFNILDCSPLFNQHMDGTAPKVRFTVVIRIMTLLPYRWDLSRLSPVYEKQYQSQVLQSKSTLQSSKKQGKKMLSMVLGFYRFVFCFLPSNSSFSLKLTIICLGYCQIFLNRHDGDF